MLITIQAARAAGLALLAAVATSAGAQTVAITGGRVYPVSGPPIENGTVVIRDGRITAVGAGIAVPAGAQRIDATGKWVTPGLINSATELGLYEIGAVNETREAIAVGREGIAAAFTAWEGLNPASVLIAPARNEGITSVVAAPAGNLLVTGQAALIDLVDGSAADMIVRAPLAMIAQVGNAQGANLGARGELLVRMRELLEDARAFAANRAAFERNQARRYSASRPDLEAMIPVVQGRLPLIVAASKASDIEAALKLGRDYGLRLMIAGAAEGWLVADQLAAAKVPVLAGAMNNIPSSFSSLGTRQENVALLRRAGVPVLIIGNSGGGDEEAFNVRNLKQEAGNAIAYGLPWDEALRAVTLTPAEAFGLADRYGSLQPGRVANVVVWSGDPFEFTTRAEHVLVRGREIVTPTRQDMLTERYKSLPPSYRQP
jgi:imidazolonepropionase-like amidohydrolase